MSDKNVRLLGEIRKLITNVIFKKGGVYLPEIGSLSIESNNGVKKLAFSKAENQPSIVKIIAKRGNCTEEQAYTVYKRWFEQVQVGEMFEIDGVALIGEDQFKVSPEFEEKLNPESKEPKEEKQSNPKEESKPQIEEKPKIAEQPKVVEQPKPKQEKPKVVEQPKQNPKKKVEEPKRGGCKKGWGIAAMVVIVAVVAAVSSGLFSDDKSTDIEVAKPITKVEPAENTSKQEEHTPTTLPELSEKQAVAPIPEAKPTQAEAKPSVPKSVKAASKITSKARYADRSIVVKAMDEAMVSGANTSKRFRVVSGVYSSKINAGRMVMDIKERTKGQGITPTAYNRGEGYMVVMFESNWVKECSEFLANVASKYYTTTWIYDNARDAK